MTVRELKEILSEYPDNIEVFIPNKYGDPSDLVRSVKLQTVDILGYHRDLVFINSI